MNLSIIIPNYDGQNLLEKNLPKVFDAIALHKDGGVEVIAIDDCSTDNSMDILESLKRNMKSLYPTIKFKIIKNEKNLGFSSAINRGVKNADGDILILINTDVVPERNFLKPLLNHFQNENIFAVGCMDKSIENGKFVLRGRGIGEWKRGFFVHSRGEVDKKNTLWVNGGSGAFRKNIWEKLGGFNELYNPFYWEDIDLSYRAIKSGYKVLFEPNSVVVHEHEKGAIKKKFSPMQIKSISYRNQFIFAWKNATDLKLELLHVLWLPFYFTKALIERDVSFFIGLFNAFILLPKVIKYKLKDKKLFILKDSQAVAPFKK